MHACHHDGKVLGVLCLDHSLPSTIDPRALRPQPKGARGFQGGELKPLSLYCLKYRPTLGSGKPGQEYSEKSEAVGRCATPCHIQ